MPSAATLPPTGSVCPPPWSRNTTRKRVIGGQGAAGTVLDTVEEYLAQAVVMAATPHTSITDSLGASAPRARFGIASSLTTNQIYVIGGVDGSSTDTSTVLEYSIATNGP